jgi:hypothetical protein
VFEHEDFGFAGGGDEERAGGADGAGAVGEQARAAPLAEAAPGAEEEAEMIVGREAVAFDDEIAAERAGGEDDGAMVALVDGGVGGRGSEERREGVEPVMAAGLFALIKPQNAEATGR